MLDFIDVQQNTDDWYKLRAGKLTSSKLGVIMANYGKAFGEPAKKYAVSIAIEQITGEPTSSDYTNEHMQRGHEQEPIARMLYEQEYFCDVTNGGFWNGDFIGCSPDGMVAGGGCIEIKSVVPSVHYANIKRKGVDPAYKWQCIGNLMLTGSDWLDFVSYSETFPIGKRLYTHRISKENYNQEFEQINARICEFERLVEDTKNTIINSDYWTT